MSPDNRADETHFMSRALILAHKGKGRVEPNPMVGCVLVNNGKIVGEGWHRRFGGPHAEVIALRQAGKRAKGATAYVTLEPCSHFGKTPPCADALIRAGIARVFAAMKDPNPIVSGHGFKKLRDAGIKVQAGLLQSESAALNAPFITVQTQHRPWIILKWAQSLDGKIATRTGDSKWITSPQSRAAAHALRARVDAIIVGINTILADDPNLTARHVTPVRIATRIVLDSQLRIPLNAKIVRTARQVPTLIVTDDRKSSKSRAARLQKKGCEVLQLPASRSGIKLTALLKELARRGMTNLMVEGGGQVLGAFWQAQLADELHIFVAPRLIGGQSAPGPLRNSGPPDIKSALPLTPPIISTHGPDICYTFYQSRP